MDGLIATALVRVALVALLAPIWVPAVWLLRRLNRSAAVAILLFLLWVLVLEATVGLERLRVLLGWTI